MTNSDNPAVDHLAALFEFDHYSYALSYPIALKQVCSEKGKNPLSKPVLEDVSQTVFDQHVAGLHRVHVELKQDVFVIDCDTFIEGEHICEMARRANRICLQNDMNGLAISSPSGGFHCWFISVSKFDEISKAKIVKTLQQGLNAELGRAVKLEKFPDGSKKFPLFGWALDVEERRKIYDDQPAPKDQIFARLEGLREEYCTDNKFDDAPVGVRLMINDGPPCLRDRIKEGYKATNAYVNGERDELMMQIIASCQKMDKDNWEEYAREVAELIIPNLDMGVFREKLGRAKRKAFNLKCSTDVHKAIYDVNGKPFCKIKPCKDCPGGIMKTQVGGKSEEDESFSDEIEKVFPLTKIHVMRGVGDNPQEVTLYLDHPEQGEISYTFIEGKFRDLQHVSDFVMMDFQSFVALATSANKRKWEEWILSKVADSNVTKVFAPAAHSKVGSVVKAFLAERVGRTTTHDIEEFAHHFANGTCLLLRGSEACKIWFDARNLQKNWGVFARTNQRRNLVDRLVNEMLKECPGVKSVEDAAVIKLNNGEEIPGEFIVMEIYNVGASEDAWFDWEKIVTEL